MICCGLWMTYSGDSEESAPVPLTGVSVNVRIIDLAAVVLVFVCKTVVCSPPPRKLFDGFGGGGALFCGWKQQLR